MSRARELCRSPSLAGALLLLLLFSFPRVKIADDPIDEAEQGVVPGDTVVIEEPPAIPSQLQKRFDDIDSSLLRIEREVETLGGPGFLQRMSESFLTQFVWSLFSSDASAGSIFALLATLMSAISLGVRIALKYGAETRSRAKWKTRLTTFLVAYVLLGIPAIVLLGSQRATPLEKLDKEVERLRGQINAASTDLSLVVSQLEEAVPERVRDPGLAKVAERLGDIDARIARLDARIARLDARSAGQASSRRQTYIFVLLVVGFVSVIVVFIWSALRSSRGGAVARS